MVKKTFLSLAVATALVSITGCNVSTTDRHENKIINEGVDYAQSSSVYPLFNPQPADGSAPQLPLATDIIFSVNNVPDGTLGKDGTAQTVDNQVPVTTAVNKLAGFSTDVYEASSILLDDGKTPAVRILFKQPLEPKSKYLVVFTDGIKGLNGENAGSAATYAILESPDPINGITDQQQSLRTTIQNWQKLANAVLGGKGKSVFSYTFTTDGSLDDLKQYAAPGLFVKNNLTVAEAEAITDAAAEAKGLPENFSIVARTIAVVMGGGDPQSPSDLMAVTSEQIAQIKASPGYSVQLFNAIATADNEVAPGVTLKLTDAAQAPKARTVVATGTSVPSEMLTTSDSLVTTHTQGTIELPDFLGLPIKTADMAVDTGGQLPPELLVPATLMADPVWTANTTVGALLAGAGKPGLPPKDVIQKADGSTVETTNVTYHYPFPQPTAAQTITVPYLLTLPGDYSLEGGAIGPQPTLIKP